MRIFLLLVLFLFSCIPPKGKPFNPPPRLDYENTPKPFKGTLYVADFRLPFKYYPERDRIVFPIIYLGFVGYKNKTLKLGKHTLTFPLELWRILKHRLVRKGFEIFPTSKGYRIEGKIRTVFVRLYTSKGLKPLKAEICNQSGCLEVSYKGSIVEVKTYGISLDFKLED